MTDVTQHTIVPVDDKLEQFTSKLLELGDKLIEGAEPATRMAWEVTMQAVQFQGMFFIGWSIAWLIAGLVLLFISQKLVRAIGADDDKEKEVKKKDAKPYKGMSSQTQVIYAWGVAIFGFFGAILTIGGIVGISESNQWIAAVAPEAAIALKLLGNVL